ncbi:MAG TPA: DUF3943 domain-containing protein [Methylomirabilota bacterium]|nr:DUF3943 domain-containing protein [Methylomirabilota bacterium]
MRCWLLIAALTVALTAPGPGTAAEPLSRDTGERESYVIPALEIAGFLTGLNQVNRHFIDSKEYGSDGHSIWKNLREPLIIDEDPFSINQLGHPYQGNIYFGFARSAGLDFWRSLAYSLGGSLLWEIAGETTPPALNDHVNTAIGGAFIGEATFRMASLLLEGGGEKPGFWRELGAAILSPPTGFNRLAFGDRFDKVFPSHRPEVFIRLRLGATLTNRVDNDHLSRDVKRQEGAADYSITYGLPGKRDYQYKRPFDYFHFEFTAVPTAGEITDAIENVSVRGLIGGRTYELGDDFRGVWGVFGNYDYFSPQIFRVSSTGVSIGTVFQWWLTRQVALQGTALGGIGLGAAGTVGNRAEREYHYGLTPLSLLGFRLIFGERAMLEATGRQYYVAGTSSNEESGVDTRNFSQDVIMRGSVGLTVRIYGPHALGIQYLVTSRNTGAPDLRDRHQSVQTVTLSYNFLGHTRFGAVEWRPAAD